MNLSNIMLHVKGMCQKEKVKLNDGLAIRIKVQSNALWKESFKLLLCIGRFQINGTRSGKRIFLQYSLVSLIVGGSVMTSTPCAAAVFNKRGKHVRLHQERIS